MSWSISKLGDFLSNMVHVTQKVKNCQNPSTFTGTKLTFNKLRQKPRYNPGRISAVSMISSNLKFSSSAIQSDQHSSQFTITKRRLCIFCTQDHWDSECDVYITANGRRNRLKSLKKCSICFKYNHSGERCKINTIVRCATAEIQIHQTA